MPQGVRDFIGNVFRGGRQPADVFATSSPKLLNILDAPWFNEGLPAGAHAMTETYRNETRTLRESRLFKSLTEKVMAALDPFNHGVRAKAVDPTPSQAV